MLVRPSLSHLGPHLPTVTRTLSPLPLWGALKELRNLGSNYLRLKWKEKAYYCKQTGYFIHSDELWKHLDN